MNPRSRTLAVVLGAVALAGAAGIGVAAGGDSSATNHHALDEPARRGFDLSLVGGRARREREPAPGRARGGSAERRRACRGSLGLAETLAEELDLSVDEVQAALEATMPAGGPGGGPPGADGATPPGADGTTPPGDDGTTPPGDNALRPATA